MSVDFHINQIGHVTEFTNRSQFTAVISMKPVKPKRRVLDVFVVKEGSSLITEHPVKIEDIYISFLNN